MQDLFDLLSSGESEERKERLKTAPSMEELLYDMIKKYHLDLSKDEQDELCRKLESNLKIFQCRIFYIKECRDLIFREWILRREERYGPTPSIAKLSADYNSSIRGHNQEITEKLTEALESAQYYFETGNEPQGVMWMLVANLNRALYYSPDIFTILEREVELGNLYAIDALAVKAEIQETREKLVRCVLKAIADIASSKIEGIRIHKGFGSPSITVLSFADVVQEGVIVAMDKTLTYNMYSKAKWSSYAYGWIKRDLSHYIAENTRTVPIPRTVIDRMQPVIKAVGLIGDGDYEAVALLANKINAEQKERSVGRKLRRKELYTAKEIEKLLPILHNTSEMSLDVTLTDTDEGNREVTVGDLIGVTEEPIYHEVDTAVIGHTLRKVLPQMMTEEQWEVLKIRWGLDDGVPRGLEETTSIYKSRFPERRMNKGKVKDIEAKVLISLQDKKEGILTELHDAAEAIIDRRGENAVYTDER